jgi:hypothetical protein
MSECAVYHITKDGTFCEKYQPDGKPSIITKVAEPGERYVEKVLGRSVEHSCGCQSESACACGSHSVEKMASATAKKNPRELYKDAVNSYLRSS